MDKSKWRVHQAHCCVIHGCKYGDKDCPVIKRQVKQTYLCEYCGEEDYTQNEIDRAFSGLLYVEPASKNIVREVLSVLQHKVDNNLCMDAQNRLYAIQSILELSRELGL